MALYDKLECVMLTYSDNEPKQQYLTANKSLVANFQEDIDMTNETCTWNGDESESKGAEDQELHFTDRLYRVVACGKQTESIEVVSIYNGWTKYENGKRHPVYILHYTGLSKETSTTPHLQVTRHSLARDEAVKHKLNGDIHLEVYNKPLFHVVQLDDFPNEVRYNCFVVLDREGTRYTLPPLLEKDEQRALDALRERGKKLCTTFPVPCFSTNDGHVRSNLILDGNFRTDVSTLDLKLQHWEHLATTATRETPLDVVEKWGFLFVDDDELRTEKLISKDWKDKLPLRATWKSHLKKLCAPQFGDRIDEISKKNEEDRRSYGQLKNILRKQCWA